MLIHDWLFLEQYLSASLMMPIAIEMFRGHDNNNVESLKKEKLKARKTVLFANITFYIGAVGWLVVSTATGKFVWRMSIEAIYVLETIVFLWSFGKIQKFIKKVNIKGLFTPKKNLMLAHLLAY